jgi:hypothetical protein
MRGVKAILQRAPHRLSKDSLVWGEKISPLVRWSYEIEIFFRIGICMEGFRLRAREKIALAIMLYLGVYL